MMVKEDTFDLGVYSVMYGYGGGDGTRDACNARLSLTTLIVIKLTAIVCDWYKHHESQLEGFLLASFRLSNRPSVRPWCFISAGRDELANKSFRVCNLSQMYTYHFR